jgi:hypothetical protein
MQFEGEWQQNSAGATQHQQQGPVESLQVIAQRVVAQNLVEPRTVLQVGSGVSSSIVKHGAAEL